MIVLTRLSAVVLLACCAFSGVQAETHAYLEAPDPSWDPVGAEVHMAYEWATFNPATPDAPAPGAVLSAPGDTYSYTVLRDDAYANNPDYEIVRAIIGVHIDDSKPGEATPKWGSITLNGKAVPFVVMNKQKDTRTPVPTDHIEIISDATLTGKAGSSTPPYIYDVTALMAGGANVRVTVKNLRKNGSDAMAGKSPFGGFIVNRIGAHVWYKKK